MLVYWDLMGLYGVDLVGEVGTKNCKNYLFL
jgi:hypothetical protein